MAAKAKAGDVERPHRQAGDLPSLKDETVCDGLPPHLLKAPTGIVGRAIDADNYALTIDYDPRLISDESVRRVAERLAPEAQRRYDKCVMRLGGRACEVCALKLERKAENIKGVRRATATFIGGVMSSSVGLDAQPLGRSGLLTRHPTLLGQRPDDGLSPTLLPLPSFASCQLGEAFCI